jgi:protein SCO1/2
MAMAGGKILFATFLIAIIVFGFSGEGIGETKFKKTIENYTVPDVTLVNQTGAKVKLMSIVNSGKPVMMDFVFTTCTTICPVLSAGFSNFQNKMGPAAGEVQLISISIDPENDTPRKMKEYLKRFDARPGWDFLTGSRKDIDKVISTFNAAASNKMSHLPLILIRTPVANTWVRINGFIGTAELMDEYRKAAKK